MSNQNTTEGDCPPTICSASLESQIATLQDELKPMLSRMEKLRRKLRDTQSAEFIAANKITRADVELSDGDGKPYFSDVWTFAKWLPVNSEKKWAEWNGRIYHAADLVNGKMPDMPATVDSLPNTNVETRQPHSDTK